MPLRRFALFALLATLMVGCASHYSQLEPPEITVSNIALQNVGLFEQQWEVTLRAHNPNGKQITVKQLSYDLLLGEARFARGSTQQKVVLPSNDSAVFTTQVNTQLLSTLNQLRKLNLAPGQAVPYQITGKAKVGMVPSALPFTTTGEIPLPSW